MQSVLSTKHSLLRLLVVGLLASPLAGPAFANQYATKQGHSTETAVDVGGGVMVVLDVAKTSDTSIQADLAQLLPDLQDLRPLHEADETPPEIVVRYRGKGRAGKRLVRYPQPAVEQNITPEEDPDTLTFLAFNSATLNEFEVQFPRPLLRKFHQDAVATGQNRPVMVKQTATHDTKQEDETAADMTPQAWSGFVDNRVRFYGVNAPVTHWERQRVSDFGGCTATLIGPRHVITAAHCVYDSSKPDPWVDDVWLYVARNGTSNLDAVKIDNDNIPNGQVLWYWVPAGYINTGHHQYDISIIVTPKRLGETTGGWMGWWVLNSITMGTQSVWNVGYPGCVAFTSNGTPRIDEPSPCSENHLYGDVNTCAPAQYTNVDGDGWSRNFRHRCDASGGQSGSPLYLNYNGKGWGVTGVHTQSLCGTISGSPCNAIDAVRPLRATRITPEYSGVISFFRNLYP